MARSSQTEYERVAGVLEACADAEKRLGGHPYRAKIMRRSAELLRRADVLLCSPRGERKVQGADLLDERMGRLRTAAYRIDEAWAQERVRVELPVLLDRVYTRLAAIRSEAQGEDNDLLTRVQAILPMADSYVSWCRHRHDNDEESRREMDDIVREVRELTKTLANRMNGGSDG